jgi:putative ubiquitin-RnfH superfamily antitoxin RatB of RatAB toxin-antitoxin module
MKIHLAVKGVAPLYKLLGKKNDIDITFSGNTLQDLINELIKKFGNGVKKAILDDKEEIDMEIRVSVNQIGFLSYGERMEASLKENDKIYIMGVG